MTKPNRKITTTRINANGDVVRINDDDNNDDPTATSSAFLRSGGTALDVFGFNLQVRQFLILLGILSFMLGIRGTLGIIALLGVYTLWNRIAPSGSNRSNGGSNNDGPSGGRASRRGEPRIRGIKDLPCDPKGG